jgi:hypothetical protein
MERAHPSPLEKQFLSSFLDSPERALVILSGARDSARREGPAFLHVELEQQAFAQCCGTFVSS